MPLTGFLNSSFEQKQKRRDYAIIGQSQLVDGRYVQGKVDTITVTAAQVLAMFGTPVPLLLAPTANPIAKRIFLPTKIVVQVIPGTTQFASGGAVSFVYHGGAVSPVVTLAAAQVNSATGTVNVLGPVSAAFVPPLTTSIDITNATGAFTTGNGTLQVTFFYDDYCSE